MRLNLPFWLLLRPYQITILNMDTLNKMLNTKLPFIAKMNHLMLIASGFFTSGLLKRACKHISSLCVALTMLVSVATMLMPSQVMAQQQNPNVAALPPIISFLLSDDDQCPVVSLETTQFINNTLITTQAELNALQGVTRIEGDLEFSTLDASLDFSPLDSLVELTGNLNFVTPSITTISGFGCLSTVGLNLDIFSNDALTSILGFNSLTSIGGFLSINSNDALTSIPEFNSLTSIGGFLNITSNEALTSIPEFNSLTSIGDNLFIITNDALTSILGFNSLTSIGDDLNITANDALTSISGFNSLPSIGDDLNITSNDALTSIPEFNSLTSIGDFLGITSNNALTSIPEFNSLTSIGGDLNINTSDALTSILGFNSLTSIGDDLEILSNNALTSIEGFGILKSEDVGGIIQINNNGDLDCTNPAPNFLPVSTSTGNSVNCAALIERQFTASPNLAIPDNNSSGVSTDIVISDQPGAVSNLEVRLNISHTFIGDLIVSLSNGTNSIDLLNTPLNSSENSCSSNDIDVTLSDSATSPINEGSCNDLSSAQAFTSGAVLSPLGQLTIFNGDDVNDTWTLTVSDNVGADIGTINSWSLDFDIGQ